MEVLVIGDPGTGPTNFSRSTSHQGLIIIVDDIPDQQEVYKIEAPLIKPFETIALDKKKESFRTRQEKRNKPWNR